MFDLCIICVSLVFELGAVHILRQPGEGVQQMLTIADEGGRGIAVTAGIN